MGNTPNVAKAAVREQAEAQAREELAKLDVRYGGAAAPQNLDLAKRIEATP